MLGFLSRMLLYAAIIAVLYYILLRKIPLSTIAKVLKFDMEIEDQTGMFAFKSLKLRNKVCSLALGSSDVSISLYQLITGAKKRKGIVIDVDSISAEVDPTIVDFYKKDITDEPVAPSKDSLLTRNLAILLVTFFLRKLEINIAEIKIKYGKITLKTGFQLKYSRKDRFKCWIKLADSELQLKDKTFKIGEFEITAGIDISCVRMIFTPSLLIVDAILPKLAIETSNQTVSIHPLNVTFDMNPGKAFITCTRIDFTQFLTLPSVVVTLKSLAAYVALPLAEVKNAKMTAITVSFEELNVKAVSEHFVNIKDVKVAIDDLKRPDLFDINVDSASMNYSTLDGLNLFVIVKQLMGPYEPMRPCIVFPDGKASVRKLDVKLIMTDNGVVTLDTGDVSFSNRKVVFPEAKVYFHDDNVFTLKNLGISSPDHRYLTFDADLLQIRDDKRLNIGDVFINIVYGWRLIKPLCSRNMNESETIPFPIKIVTKELLFCVDDTNVNKKLSQLHKTMPDFLRDKIILKHILDSKIAELEFREKEVTLANEQLGHLIFKNFRNMYNELKFHEWAFHAKIENAEVLLDSCDIGENKEELLARYSPATAERYPDAKWETLEGFNMNLTISHATFDAYDLKYPMFSGDKLVANTTLLVAELWDGKHIEIPTTVCGQPFMVPATINECKMYGDVKIAIDDFDWYMGSAYQKILDQFADQITSMIPASDDPSPDMKWWDKLRSMYHGPFEVKAKRIGTNFIGGTDFNQENNVLCETKGVYAAISEGLWQISAGTMTLYRKKGGPSILHLPQLTTTVVLEWDTPCGDQKKHLWKPDFDHLYDSDYDTFKDFRATGLCATITLSTKRDELTPYLQVDLAHLRWLIEPIWNLFDGPPLNETNAKKYGVPAKERRPERFHMGDLDTRWIIKIVDSPRISMRIFDHFPVENSSMFCSSVDLTLVEPNITIDILNTTEVTYDAELMAKSITGNATDLPIYNTNFSKTGNSTTFCLVSDPVITYHEMQLQVTASGIKIYANQLFVVYLTEFAKAMLSVPVVGSKNKRATKEEPKPETDNNENTDTMALPLEDERKQNNILQALLDRRVSQRFVLESKAKQNMQSRMKESPSNELDRYTNEAVRIQIPAIQFVFESLLYDARIFCGLNELNLCVNTCPNDDKLAANLHFDSFLVVSNVGFDPTPDQLVARLVEFMGFNADYWEHKDGHFLAASVDELKLKMMSGDVALICLFKDELMKALKVLEDKAPKTGKKERQEKPDTGESIPLRIDTRIARVSAEITSDQGYPVGSLDIRGVSWKATNEKDRSRSTIGEIAELEITDKRKNEKPQKVAGRWNQQCEVNHPLIRVQAKQSPSVGGIPVFPQVEVNLDPVIMIYDASFFHYLIALAVEDELKVREFVTTKFAIPKTAYNLPKVLLPEGFLPSIDSHFSFDMETKSSKDYCVKFHRAERNFLLRYFKITSIKLNVSYFNPENRAVPSITEFNGVLHDVIMQDFTATMKTFTKEVLSQVAKDMIPQFMKHVFGLNNKITEKASELNMWLENDHDKAVQRKQELLFGKKKGK